MLGTSYGQNLRNFFVAQRCIESTTYQTLKSLGSAQREILAHAADDEPSVYWLLPYRNDLRRIYVGFHARCNDFQVDAIQLYMRRYPESMTPLCVWLIGKCVDRFRLYGLAGLWNDPSPVVRRQVAKALRRAEAWSQLAEMARAYPDDDRIVWYATAPPTHRPFAQRLTNYVGSIDDSHADEVETPSRMSYWTLEKEWKYTPPKSRDLIRRMLRRIRHWVRWGRDVRC
jgi:hypothetical protein